MEDQQVTIEMLYNYLVLFKKDTDQHFKNIYQRLDNIEYHLALHDRQFEQLEKRMDRIEEKVQELYDKRDKISMEFNRRVLFGTGMLAGIVAFIVAMFTGKYKPYW